MIDNLLLYSSNMPRKHMALLRIHAQGLQTWSSGAACSRYNNIMKVSVSLATASKRHVRHWNTQPHCAICNEHHERLSHFVWGASEMIDQSFLNPCPIGCAVQYVPFCTYLCSMYLYLSVQRVSISAACIYQCSVYLSIFADLTSIHP